MLLPPLYYGANAVSTWIPWSGGPSIAEFLDSDWKFREHLIAGAGISSYSGQDRKSLLKQKGLAYNTALTQIDTINQADAMVRNLISLSKTQFESLFH